MLERMKTVTPFRHAVLTCAGVFFALAGLAAEPPADQTRDEIFKLPWQQGPVTGNVGSKATLAVPKGAALLPESNGSRFLELTGNLPSPGETILYGGNWWAAMSYRDVGHVNDDEKLDPDALLKAMQENDEAGNAERKKLNITQLHTDGWIVQPHYDNVTKYLEWGVKLHSDDSPQPIVNYSVRLLGRTGYQTVVLVSTPETLQRDIGELKTMLQSFSFNSGSKYSEFKPGDHVAEIGLGALVLGGAAAAAVKSGFWKTLLVALAAGWKLVAGVVVALLAGIGRLFKRKST